jgi:hypothetical protein
VKFTAHRPFADPEAAARKLLEFANVVEPYMDQRVLIELINGAFLSAGGSPPSTRPGLTSLSPRAGCGNMKAALM